MHPSGGRIFRIWYIIARMEIEGRGNRKVSFSDVNSFQNGCIGMDFHNRTIKQPDGEISYLRPAEMTLLSVLNPDEVISLDNIIETMSRIREIKRCIKEDIDPGEKDFGKDLSRENVRLLVNSLRRIMGFEVIQGRVKQGYRLLSEKEFLERKERGRRRPLIN